MTPDHIIRQWWMFLGYSAPDERIPRLAFQAVADRLGVSRQVVGAVYHGRKPFPRAWLVRWEEGIALSGDSGQVIG